MDDGICAGSGTPTFSSFNFSHGAPAANANAHYSWQARGKILAKSQISNPAIGFEPLFFARPKEELVQRFRLLLQIRKVKVC